MIALENGHYDLVKTLIEAGANVNHSDKVSVCALLLYSISAHTVVPWFYLCLTMDSLFLYVIKQIHMDHLPFTTTYMYYIKWLGLKQVCFVFSYLFF